MMILTIRVENDENECMNNDRNWDVENQSDEDDNVDEECLVCLTSLSK